MSQIRNLFLLKTRTKLKNTFMCAGNFLDMEILWISTARVEFQISNVNYLSGGNVPVFVDHFSLARAGFGLCPVYSEPYENF